MMHGDDLRAASRRVWRRTLLVGSLGLFALGAGSAQPSFKCDKPAWKAEKLVCSDTQLAALDRELARLYGLARKGAADRPPRAEALTRSQREWIRDRNECWKGVDPRQCVAMSYARRIAEVRTNYGESRRADAKGTSLGPMALRCEGRDRLMSATFINVEPRVVWLDRGEGSWLLQNVPSGSGAKYQGRAEGLSGMEDYELWTQRDEAMLTLGARPTMKCKVESIG